MAEETQQESKKTVVSFVVGLLIGGLLVWAFSGPAADAPETNGTNNADSEMSADSDSDQSDGEDTAAGEDGESTDESVDTEESKGGDPIDESAPEVTELPTGDGSVEVSDQPAGSTVALESVVYPIDEGWVAVRDYTDEQLGNILGAARFSKEQGLVPEEVPLLAPTTAGNVYAIVFFTENGDREFNLANDVQVDSVFATFTAQ